MSELSDIKVPYIKMGATVNIGLSTGTIADIQSVLLYILKGRKDDEIAVIGKKLIDKVPLEDWERCSVIITQLLQMIQRSAEDSGQTELRTMENAIKDAFYSS